MVLSERSDAAARVRESDRLAGVPVRAAAPEPRPRVGWLQVLGLVVAAAAIMLAVAGVVGVVAGSLARLADGDAMADVLAFVLQGVALVVGSLVVGFGVLGLLVRGERRRVHREATSSYGDEPASTA